MKKIVITGGGTAGHLNPGLAVAHQLERPDSSDVPEGPAPCEVLYIGCEQGIEAEKLPNDGISYELIPAKGFTRSLGMHLFKTFEQNAKGFTRAREILRNYKPDAVLATGGYVSVPVLLAARMSGIPYVIHEQNAVPGLTVKLFGGGAYSVCISLKHSEPNFKRMRTVLTGCPINEAISSAFADLGKAEGPLSSITSSEDRLTVLIFGGSLGAKRINETVLSVLDELQQGELKLPQTTIIHASGTRDARAVKEYVDKKIDIEALQKAGVVYELHEYISDMAAFYERADIIVARSGAATVAEIIATGRPAILVPYPFATNDHQVRNARILEAAAAATIILDDDLNAHLLAATLNALRSEPSYLASQKAALTKMSTPHAARAVAEIVLQAVLSQDSSPRTLPKGASFE